MSRYVAVQKKYASPEAGSIWHANAPESLQLDAENLLHQFEFSRTVNGDRWGAVFFALWYASPTSEQRCNAVSHISSPMPCISNILSVSVWSAGGSEDDEAFPEFARASAVEWRSVGCSVWVALRVQRKRRGTNKLSAADAGLSAVAVVLVSAVQETEGIWFPSCPG